MQGLQLTVSNTVEWNQLNCDTCSNIGIDNRIDGLDQAINFTEVLAGLSLPEEEALSGLSEVLEDFDPAADVDIDVGIPTNVVTEAISLEDEGHVLPNAGNLLPPTASINKPIQTAPQAGLLLPETVATEPATLSFSQSRVNEAALNISAHNANAALNATPAKETEINQQTPLSDAAVQNLKPAPVQTIQPESQHGMDAEQTNSSKLTSLVAGLNEMKATFDKVASSKSGKSLNINPMAGADTSHAVTLLNRQDIYTQPTLTSPEAKLPSATASPDALPQQIAMMVNNEIKSAVIQLDPKDLGQVKIHLTTDQDKVGVHIVVNNHLAKEALDATLPRLRDSLQNSGFDLSHADVDDQSGQSQNSGASSEQDRSSLLEPTPRSIDLDEAQADLLVQQAETSEAHIKGIIDDYV